MPSNTNNDNKAVQLQKGLITLGHLYEETRILTVLCFFYYKILVQCQILLSVF